MGLPKSIRVTKDVVERAGRLAMIDLSESESVQLSKELSKILDYFRKIDEVDTKDVPPTYHVIEFYNILRKDEPKPFSAKEVLDIVPVKKGKYVKAARMV